MRLHHHTNQAKLVVSVLSILLVTSFPAFAWDVDSCGERKSYLPNPNCPDERCCQCNYQYDLEQCGKDEWCKKGALETMKACNTRSQKPPKASMVLIAGATGRGEWTFQFSSLNPGASTLWVVNGNGNGTGDGFAVSEAEIRINGETVVSPLEMNGTVDELTIPVTLLGGANEVAIGIEADTGDTLTIIVY